MATTVSAEDEARTKSISDQWKQRQAEGASQSELNDIHHMNEAIKAKYGYSGGDDGTGYIPLANVQSSDSNSYYGGGSGDTSSNAYVKQLYEMQSKAQVDALKNAYDKNVAALNSAAAKIPETYNTARNSTASTYAQNQQAFNERAAASGINSGTGSQAALAMGNVYQGNISALDKAQAQAVADINAKRVELESSYNAQINQALAQNELAKAQALYNDKVRADDLLLQQQQYQDSLNQQNRQYDFESKQYADSLAANNAQALASVGNFSGFKAAPYNWTDAQVAQAEALFRQKNTKTYAGGGYGGGGNENNNNQNVGLFGYDANTTYSALKSQGYPDWQIIQSAQTDYKNGDMTAEEYKAIVNAVQINAATQRRNS